MVVQKGSSRALLSLRNVATSYGRIRALKGISLVLMPGEIVCLIGANGAGKTTTLKTICGLLKPNQGSIIFDADRSITALPPHRNRRTGNIPSYWKVARFLRA